jgi:hypothetical protein
LGEHSLEVLEQLGFDAATIEAFVSQGAIASSAGSSKKTT